MKKKNCWEVIKCGRENKGEDCFFSEIDTCPASTELCTDGVNGGKFGGRACWVIAGTMCGGKAKGNLAAKLKTCMDCEFYKQVKEEEGDRFVTGSELLEIVMYGNEIVDYRLHREVARQKKMYKNDLVKKLTEEIRQLDPEAKNGETSVLARKTVNIFFSAIKDALSSGDRVELRGFGTFQAKQYEGYVGRNPKTGEKVTVNPKKLPIFRPGKDLKKAVSDQ